MARLVADVDLDRQALGPLVRLGRAADLAIEELDADVGQAVVVVVVELAAVKPAGGA